MPLRLVDLVVYRWLGLDPGSTLHAAFPFFLCDTLKIFLRLAVTISVIGVIRTWLPEPCPTHSPPSLQLTDRERRDCHIRRFSHPAATPTILACHHSGKPYSIG